MLTVTVKTASLTVHLFGNEVTVNYFLDEDMWGQKPAQILNNFLCQKSAPVLKS